MFVFCFKPIPTYQLLHLTLHCFGHIPKSTLCTTNFLTENAAMDEMNLFSFILILCLSLLIQIWEYFDKNYTFKAMTSQYGSNTSCNPNSNQGKYVRQGKWNRLNSLRLIEYQPSVLFILRSANRKYIPIYVWHNSL